MGSERLCILLIGSGGREHALAWKLSQSPLVDSIFVVPGNGGTARGLPKVKNISEVGADDFLGLVAFAKKHEVNLVVPGPEAPLVAGIERFFREAGIRCFGPTKDAAKMEGSKTFAKDFMARHRIPSAQYRNFSVYEEAMQYLDDVCESHNVVIKATGLAAGKGVILPSTKEEARTALEGIMLKREFGSAGDEVVIEEYLEGEELSILSFSDGYTIKSLPAAQDHKQIHDGDKGPNTGGMGCYAPTNVATPQLIEEIHRTILQPTIDGMRKERYPFVGILFTGLMITKDGPKTLEYNVRFGDPETQTLLPLMNTDLAEVMIACTDRWLDGIDIKIKPKCSATVVASAGGYPGPYVRGETISIDTKGIEPDSVIFHAGTSLSSGVLQSSGGRVIAATSTASSLKNTLSLAYQTISRIKFHQMHFRTDIGHRALSHPGKAAQPSTTPSMTYETAGVSISAGNELVNRIRSYVGSTARPGASAEIGGFGGTFNLHAAGYPESPILVGGMDGVGTKLSVALALGKHDTIGQDLVAMCVNDLVVQGAEPLLFMDTYSCGKLDVDVAKQVVMGICKACEKAKVALIGGETAEMRGVFANEDIYDIVGSTLGAVERGKKILPDMDSMQTEDVLLGLASSGCHSNGYTLITKIVESSGLKNEDKAPWGSGESVGESLLTPTRIYVEPLLGVVKKNLVKGMAHITGGGLIENVPRMLPKHLAAEMSAKSWPVPPVLGWLKKSGRVEDNEFAKTFNTGLGMVLVVAKGDAEVAMEELRAAGETVYVAGFLKERVSEREGCVLTHTEVWDS